MKKNTLFKNLCNDFLQSGLKTCSEIESKEPIKEKKQIEFIFKNHLYNNEQDFSKKDFSEFFSRINIREKLEENDDFELLLPFLSEQRKIKKFYSQPDIDVKNLIYYLIENFCIENNSFSFNSEKFEKLVKEFITYVNEEILKISYFTPLYNFASDINEKHFGNITIKRISAEQFKIIKENLVGSELPTPSQLFKLAYVLETKIPFVNDVYKEDELAKENFLKFIQGALIFQSGDLQVGSFYRNYTKWTKYSSRISENDNFISGRPIYKIKKQKINLLKKFYDEFSSNNLEQNELSFIKLALNRFHLGMSKTDITDKIVDLNITLECLFSSSIDTSIKFSNRICTLIAKNDEEREFYWNFVKSEYKLRSDIVHGRGSKVIVINGQEMNLEITSEYLEDIARISIKKFLNLIKHYTGKKIRDDILSDLDLGLINKSKLEKFLLKTTGVFD